MYARTAILLLSAASLAACAHPAPPPTAKVDPVSKAVTQPLHDLNIARTTIPAALKRIDKPYAQPSECEAARQEIAELNEALGPDVDSGAEVARPNSLAADLAAQTVQGALGLPFRSVIRKVSGAAERDQELKTAVLAGLLRRSYLKGLAAELCKPAASPVPVSAPASTPLLPPVNEAPKPLRGPQDGDVPPTAG